MNKKGIAWSTIIYAIIGVIVLVTLVWIFREQINEIYKSFMQIITTTGSESKEVGESLKELVEANK